ncbi:MAG: hypothetical protein IJE08_10565 [Clostridia bacterium]|nr:hypothetical protein [Clostridia bacterium]
MRRATIHKEGYIWNIFLPDGQADCAVYIPMHGTAEEIWRMLPGCQAALVSVSGFDWNKDLSPWPAKAVFGEEDFSGGADAFLKELIRLIPDVEREAGLAPVRRCIAGYSLAGLFAVYAAYRCDIFHPHRLGLRVNVV